MTTHYEPTLAQMIYGCPWGEYNLPLMVAGTLDLLGYNIEIAFSNRFRREWDYYEDPQIEGITWRHYYWGEDEYEASLPNFQFEDVEIRHYKHWGRRRTTNVDWSLDQWNSWFERCFAAVEKADSF